MDKVSRIGLALLGIAAIGLLIVVAKQRLGLDAPPAALPNSTQEDDTSEQLGGAAVRPPTILHAKPAVTEGDATAAPTALPYEEFRDTPAKGPVDRVPTLLSPPKNDKPQRDEPVERTARDVEANKSASTTTQANDSFWAISERVYGNGGFYRALFAHNRDRVATPDALRAGIELRTPPPAALARQYPRLTPRVD